MGWRMAGLMVEGGTEDVVVAALPGSPRSTGVAMSGDAALTMALDADYAVAGVGGWTVVSDPRIQAAWSGEVCDALCEDMRRVWCFLVDDLTTTHGFAWYTEEGLVRTALYVEGELEDSAGDPLPEEENLPDVASEDFVPALAARLTGIGIAALLDASYTALRGEDR